MKIHDDVFVYKSHVKMPLMKLPVNSTALKTSRGVVLIGPGAETARYESELSDFGRVTDIVAPNLLHHLSIHLAQTTFPQATIWGAPGLSQKRPDVAWDKVLRPTTWLYADEIQVTEIKGTKFNETVFFHSKSKTLVVTDLFFNLLRAKGVGAWIILNLFGTYRRFAMSSFYLRAVHDKTAFKQSLKEISNYDFDKIVMSHGDPVTTNAREFFNAALKERDLP